MAHGWSCDNHFYFFVEIESESASKQENKNPPEESSVLFQIRCVRCARYASSSPIGVCLITDWFRFCFSTSGLSKRRRKNENRTERKCKSSHLFVCFCLYFWFVGWAQPETQEHNAKYDCLMNVSSRLSWRCFDIILVLFRRSPRHRHTRTAIDWWQMAIDQQVFFAMPSFVT